MRILILTQWFEPEPTFKGMLFARQLQEQGHEVDVLTGFPNYPGGKLYPGYKQKLYQRSVIDGIRINRVPLYASHDSSAFRRILNYSSFALSSCLFGIFMARKVDIIYIYHPPLTVGVSGALIGLFRRTPFVYDIQDLWPDTLRATGMVNNERVLSIVKKVCDWVYTRANHITVLSPGFHQRLLSRGVPGNKMSIVHNWCDETALQQPSSQSVDLGFMNGKFNVVFAGGIGKAQALDSVILAAQRIKQENPAIQLVFVGAGMEVDNLKALAKSLDATNVIFVPRVPMNEVGAILAKADALLVHLKDDVLFTITIPSKTQAYMAVGKPIIMGVRGDAADLIERANAGITIEPGNPESIAQGIIRFSRLPESERLAMGENGKRFYESELSLKTGVKKFCQIFENVVSQTRRKN